jgi:hypothetical protein
MFTPRQHLRVLLILRNWCHPAQTDSLQRTRATTRSLSGWTASTSTNRSRKDRHSVGDNPNRGSGRHMYQYTARLAHEPFTCENREPMFIARRSVTDMARSPEFDLTPLLAKQSLLIADFTAQPASSELAALAGSTTRSTPCRAACRHLGRGAERAVSNGLWQARLMAGAGPRASGRPTADPSPPPAGPRPPWWRSAPTRTRSPAVT